jgi:hypothetical protein
MKAERAAFDSYHEKDNISSVGDWRDQLRTV